MWRRSLPLLLSALIILASLGAIYAEIPELPQSRITQKVEWSYKGWKISWELRIPTYAYLGYAKITPEERRKMGVANMVTHDDIVIISIASGLKNEAKQKGFGEYDTANYILAFVQSISYHKDNELTPYADYWKFPIETLAEGWGDCEDASILYAALMKAVGYDVILLSFPDHMAVGVALSKAISGVYVLYNGKRYFYAETTNPGWLIGKAPSKYTGRSVTILLIPDKPSGTKLSIEKINEELNYTTERFKQLETENSKLKQENQALKNQISKLKAENQKLSANNSELTHKNLELESQISNLKAINEKLSQENQKLIKQVWDSQKKIQELAGKNMELLSQLTELKNDIDTLNLEISNLKEEINQLSKANGIMIMIINTLIAVTIGVGAAAYYRGKRVKEKEIFGV